MSPEIALLDEVWSTIKPYIAKKERLELAEAILRLFDEHLNLEEIEEYKNEFDSVMKAAIVSHYDYYDSDQDDHDDDYGD